MITNLAQNVFFPPPFCNSGSTHRGTFWEEALAKGRVARTVQHTSEPSPANFRHLFVVKEDSSSEEKQKTKGIFFTLESCWGYSEMIQFWLLCSLHFDFLWSMMLWCYFFCLVPLLVSLQKEQLCIRNNIHLKQFASFVYFYNFVQLKFTS